MKTAFITGSTDGIGKQTAIALAEQNYRVIVHGRNRRKVMVTREEITKLTGNGNILSCVGDLSSLKSVRKISEEIHRSVDVIDVLINNAGVFNRKHRFSRDGIELTFAVNHVAVFALTLLLLDLVRNAPQGRIINVASIAHGNSPKIDFTSLIEVNSYMDYSAYSLSKLANVFFTYALSERLKDEPITVNCLHPGVISTKLLDNGFGISGAPVEEGAQTSVHVAVHPDFSHVSGAFLTNRKVVGSSPFSYDKGIRKNLWSLSEELTGIRFSDFA